MDFSKLYWLIDSSEYKFMAGAIDGKHIVLKAPANARSSFFLFLFVCFL